mgnify:FL=1
MSISNKIRNFDLGNIFFFIPLLLVTGPFLPDLGLVILSIFGIYLVIKKKVDYKKYKIFFGLSILLTTLFLISSLLSNYTLESLKYPIFYFRYVFFVLAIIYFLQNKKNFLRNFFLSFFFIYSFVLLDALVQFIFLKDLFLIPKPSNLRVTAMFGDELILGSYISRLFPIYLISIIFINKKYNYPKFINVFLILIAILVVSISGERSALFSMFIIFIFCLFFKNFFQMTSLIAIVLSILFLTLLINNNEFIKQRFYTETKNQITETLQGKHIISKFHHAHYVTAIKISKDNFFFGVGPKSFRFECNKDKYNIPNACSTHPHNTYIQLLSETGIFSFIIVISIFIYCFYKIFKIKLNSEKNESDDIRFFLYIALIISLWPFTPSGSFFNNWLNIIYYLPIAFILHLDEKNKNFTYL